MPHARAHGVADDVTAADNRRGDPDMRAKTLLGTGEDPQRGALKLALNQGQAQPARRVVLVGRLRLPVRSVHGPAAVPGGRLRVHHLGSG